MMPPRGSGRACGGGGGTIANIGRLLIAGCLLALASEAAPAGRTPSGGPPAPIPPATGLELRFEAGVFDPGSGGPPPPSWHRERAVASRASPTRRVYLVAITRSPLDASQRGALESAGAEVLGYIPSRGYRLRAPSGAGHAIRGLPFVAWLGETPPYLKVSRELSDRAAREEGPITIRVVLEAGEPAGRALAALAGLDVVATPAGKDRAWRAQVSLPAGRLGAMLSELAGLPEVEALEIVRPMRVLNQDAVWVHQSFVGPSPQQTPVFDAGLFGCGQTIAVSDSGQDFGACYFSDTVNGPPPVVLCVSPPCPPGSPAPGRRKDILYYNWSRTPTGDDDLCPGFFGASGHGTHTSGSAAGDSSPYANCATFASPGRNGGDGQAPGAKLIIQEMGDGLEYLNTFGGTLWNLADVAHAGGARIHSISWGGACHDAFGTCIPGCTLPYDSFARDADLAMWTYPDLLMVISAGNAGQFCPPPVSVGTPALAKSPITVGGLGHGSAAGGVAAFSSPGPVFDGRLKPTVAAQGESVVSAASDADPASANCSGCSLDGTSMSAPTAAGLAALAREYYTAGYHATGGRDSGSGFVPSGALVKATLLDGAVALGAASPGPDFDSGYGRILLASTLALGAPPFALRVDDHRDGITTGSVVAHAFEVASGTPLRATLVWTDFPAALNAAAARVNELKLEVVDPAGAVWFQTLDPATGAPAATSDPADPHDGVNVEERLVFDTPLQGRWVFRVRGVDVPMGPQPFALVVRGALTDCPAPLAPAAPALTTPADHEVLVSWAAIPGAAAYNVYRSLGACPGGPWIPVAAGVTGTSFLDSGMSGGATFSYYVAAASDAAGTCESPPSGCAAVVPTGDCTLAPQFGGASAATSTGQATCGVTVSWSAAATRCGSDVRYNVYRATSPGFVPGPSNRIARCLAATSYTDAIGLTAGTLYHYVVRAEDATSGHAGPCRGGNEDGNTVKVAAVPAGPSALGTWTDDAGDTGVARFSPTPPWTVSPTGGASAPAVYTAASSEGVCSDLTSPPLTLDSPGTGPLLSFSTRHTLGYGIDVFELFGFEGSLGQVEIATGPGFTNWTRVPLGPDYPAQVDFPFNDCSTTQDVDRYFSGTRTDYTTYSASLANWGGGDVLIRFHLSGDYGYPFGSWWIDDVQVTQAIVPGACSTVTSGPPPVPDGSWIPGQPLEAEPAGGDVALTWDAARCPAASVNVYWGALGDFTTFTGGACGLAATGSASLAVPDDAWFVVVATNGASAAGSHGRTATGGELTYAGASIVCPAITQHVITNGCP